MNINANNIMHKHIRVNLCCCKSVKTKQKHHGIWCRKSSVIFQLEHQNPHQHLESQFYIIPDPKLSWQSLGSLTSVTAADQIRGWLWWSSREKSGRLIVKWMLINQRWLQSRNKGKRKIKLFDLTHWKVFWQYIFNG